MQRWERNWPAFMELLEFWAPKVTCPYSCLPADKTWVWLHQTNKYSNLFIECHEMCDPPGPVLSTCQWSTDQSLVTLSTVRTGSWALLRAERQKQFLSALSTRAFTPQSMLPFPRSTFPGSSVDDRKSVEYPRTKLYHRGTQLSLLFSVHIQP